MTSTVPVKRLGDLVDVVSGGTPSKKEPSYWRGRIPWVSPKDMKRWEIHDANDHVSDAAVAETACRLVKPPAVLIVVRGMILIHSIPVAISRVPLAINQDLKALLPKDGVDPEYLAFMVAGAAPDLLSRVDIAGHGTRRLPTQAWESLDIRVPAMPEQHRIVRRIHECITRVEEISALRVEAEREANALIPSCLAAVFDELAHSHETVPFGRILAETRYGTSQKCDAGPDATPVLRIPNVADGEISFENLKYCELERDELLRLVLEPGDVLVVRTNGSPDLVGRCAVFEGASKPYAFASYLIRLRLTGAADPRFLAFFLSSTRGRDAIAAIRRTSAGQYNINSENLRAIRMPLPPLEEQRRLADRLAEQRDAARSVLDEQAVRSAEAQQLRAAVIRKAFAGEL